MRHHILLLVMAMTVLPTFGQPAQEEGELLCPVEDLTGLTMLPPLNPPIAGAEVVKALMVCVSFPLLADPGIPSWLPPMAGEGVEGYLEEYVRKVSDNKQILDITFERRPAPFQAYPYIAAYSELHYQQLHLPGTNHGGHGALNEEILLQVQLNHSFEDPDYLARFDLVFMVYNGVPYSDDIGGVAALELPSDFPSAFTRRGYSVRLLNPGYANQNIHSDGNRVHGAWVQVHEYGHLLEFMHSPHSEIPENGEPCRKKSGRYDPMQAYVPAFTEWGYYPYHVLNLLQKEWILPDRVVVPSAPIGTSHYELDDVRRGGEILKIPIASYDQTEEYFLVLNHQGSDYDSYLGTGLAIWHIRDGDFSLVDYWDLEVASGMFDSNCSIFPCSPDPIAGTDSLDRSNAARAGDLWSSGSFGPGTNPSSNAYQPVICPYQKANSGISVTNITDLVGPKIGFNLTLAQPTPVISVSLDVPSQTFLGLDCAAAQTLTLPIGVTVLDADSTPLVGVPQGWMRLDLSTVPVPGATLAFCATSGVVLPPTDASGSTSGHFFHACGGGEFEAQFKLWGTAFASSDPAQLRTPDLDADAEVDVVDLGIWSNPSGPVEDDIRDLNFDLVIDQDDLELLGDQMNTELEPDIDITALAPPNSAVLAAGTTVTLQSEVCVSGGEIPLIQYESLFQGGSRVLGSGAGLTSLPWVVSPPLGNQTLRFKATASVGISIETVPIRVEAPAVAITPSFSPFSLNTIGAIGTVTVRLKDNESVPVSDITAELVLPSEALQILSGPSPAGPYDFNPGQWRDISWSVQRVSGTGGVQALVNLRLDGFTDVIKSKTSTVFGPTGG